MIPTDFLAIVDERHAVEGIGQYGERITVGTVFLRQRLLALVPVLVVVGHVEHTAEGYAIRCREHLVGIGFQDQSCHICPDCSGMPKHSRSRIRLPLASLHPVRYLSRRGR